MQANWLRSTGVKKGDAVCIYMPLVPELPLAMLACARIGAVHSVIFGGFSSEAVAQRVVDCRSESNRNGLIAGATCTERLNSGARVDQSLMSLISTRAKSTI